MEREGTLQKGSFPPQGLLPSPLNNRGSPRAAANENQTERALGEINELADKVDDIPTLFTVDLLNLDTCRNNLLLEDIKEYGRKI